MDEALFELPNYPEKHIRFDAARVREKLAKIIDDDDLRRFIL
jgi:ATP-dependent protease HslVU (ClpYQ) ATPase subunit